MKLNHEQTQAVESGHENTLVIAGPGSGKTTVIAHRIAHLAAYEPAGGVVAITYTNAAAREIQARVDSLGAGRTMKLGFIGTIHGYALRLLREHGKLLGLPARVSVMDEKQAEEMLELVTTDLHVKEPKKNIEAAVRVRLEDLSSVAVGSPRPAHLNGAQLVAFEYFYRMLESGALSFDAIVAFGAVAAQWAAEVNELLVDEYQDCNNMTHRLCMRVPSRKFFVGDSDQAIYGFAGGNIRNIIELANRDEDWRMFFLKTNYRSAPDICKAADRLIRCNRMRVHKSMECNSAHDGSVSAPEPLPTPGSEYAFIAKELSTALISRAGFAKSCAVLCRTNGMAAEVADSLLAAGISIRRKTWQEKPKDWQLARRFIALAANPENDVLAYWFICLTRGAPFANKMRLESVDAGNTLNGHYLKMPDNMDVAQVPDVLSRIGVGAESIALVKKAAETLLPEDGIVELAVALGNQELHWTETGGGVTVTTMHAAKGREWDWVFVAGAEDETIPGSRADVNVEEERRLMFVAITRARERLVITSSESRRLNRWDKCSTATTQSRFIKEMGITGEQAIDSKG